MGLGGDGGIQAHLVEMGMQEAELRWGAHRVKYYRDQAKSKSLWNVQGYLEARQAKHRREWDQRKSFWNVIIEANLRLGFCLQGASRVWGNETALWPHFPVYVRDSKPLPSLGL